MKFEEGQEVLRCSGGALKVYSLEVVSKIFEIHCPDCGGIMKYEFYDPVHKVDVFKCQDCEKEWV